MNVDSWLEEKGFGQFSAFFKKHGITMEKLSKITSHEELIEIGIKSFMHRKKMLSEMAALTPLPTGGAPPLGPPPSPGSPFIGQQAKNKDAHRVRPSRKGAAEEIVRIRPIPSKTLNEHEEAIIINSKKLHSKIKDLGHDHEEVGDCYFELGSNYYMNSQYDKAIVNHKKALAIRIKCFGEDDIDVVLSYYQLGNDYYMDSNYDLAIKNHKKALEIQIELNEDDDNNEGVAAIYFDLGKDYYYDSQYDKAIDCHEKALEIRHYIYGEDDLLVAESHYQLGLNYYAAGKFSNALSQMKTAWRIYCELGEKDSDNAQKAKDYLDELMVKTDDIEDTEVDDISAQRVETNTESGKSLNEIESWISLGDECVESKKNAEALIHYQKAMELSRATSQNSEKTKTVAEINFKLGTTCKSLEKYEEAKSYLIESTSSFVSLYGKNCFESARSYSQLGDVYYYLNEYEDAIKNHSMALESYTILYGKQVPLVAWSHYDLGLDYYWTEDYKQAISHFRSSLEIRVKLYGMQHKEVASCYHRLGLSYYWDNQYELSIKSYKQALEIRENLFGKESKAFDDLRFSLGQACYYANMAMEAKEYFLASVGFRKSEYGSSSKEYKKAKEWLDKI